MVVTSWRRSVRELDDPFEAPGLDSHRATELLTQAGSADMGLGADVVLTPRDPEETFDSPRCAGRRGPGPGSPGGACRTCSARATSCRPAGLSPADLERLKTTLDDLRETTDLRIEAGGDLYFAFEQPPAGVGEALGLVAAIVILLLAFGSVVAMGLPIGVALLGLAVGAGSLSLVATSSTSPPGRS